MQNDYNYHYYLHCNLSSGSIATSRIYGHKGTKQGTKDITGRKNALLEEDLKIQRLSWYKSTTGMVHWSLLNSKLEILISKSF
jgi:hypothetical protein